MTYPPDRPRFDPQTGLPLESSQTPQPRFDPNTGLPLEQQKPEEDPGFGRRIALAVVAVAVLVGGFVLVGSLRNAKVDMVAYSQGKGGVSFTSTEGRYTATFPKQPSSQHKSITAAGVTLRFVIDAVGGDQDGVQVAYVDYPAAFRTLSGDRLDLVLRGAANGAASNVPGGTLTSATFTRLLGHRAIQYRVDAKDVVAYARVALFDTRLYILQVTAPGVTGAQALDRLATSFRLN